MLGNRPTLIGRLRVRAGSQDSLLTQLRIERLLNPIELQPTGLPPSAILCIRALRDPLPGSLRVEQGDVRPPPAWQQAVSAMLDRLARSASRPALDVVSASAEAVVFLDRSEWLACLASDWCEGSLMTRWWWQSLLRQGAASQIVKELWRSAPEYVPAALQQLANKNQAADFVRAFSDAEARQLLREVATTFALHSLLPVLDVLDSNSRARPEPLDHKQLKNAPGENNDLKSPRPNAPWRPWVPESDAPGLGPEQELFLGVALMLQRAPVRVRAAGFPTRVRDWQEEIARAREFHRDNVSSNKGTPQAMQQGGDVAVAEQLLRSSGDRFVKSPRGASPVNEETDPRRAAQQESTVSDAASLTRADLESIDAVEVEKIGARESSAQQAGEKRGRHRADEAPSNELVASSLPAGVKVSSAATETDRRAIDSLEPRKHRSRQSFQSRQTIPAAAVAPATPDEKYSFIEDAPPTPEAVSVETERTEEWIETQLGGLFYLINLGLFLGLYGDFTTPDEPGLQLNIWDFVALLGRELVGDTIQDDPLWPLLARLAKREEGDPPGSGFEPETLSSFEFRVSSFELSTATWDRQPETRDSKLETGEAKLETRNSKLETTSAVAAWLDRLLTYVRVRLRKALGLTEEEDPGPIICRHRARICLTPTHVDLFFRLDALPIEIRLAGLDRNPGWVPAAGRFITFHFE